MLIAQYYGKNLVTACYSIEDLISDLLTEVMQTMT